MYARTRGEEEEDVIECTNSGGNARDATRSRQKKNGTISDEIGASLIFDLDRNRETMSGRKYNFAKEMLRLRIRFIFVLEFELYI